MASRVLLSTITTAALVAACGPGSDGGQTTEPKTPTTGPSASASAPAGPSAKPNATVAPPAKAGAMMAKGIAPTAMEAELKELGLDPKALPPLNKMEPNTLRKVMKTFNKALGVQCNACHDTKDFKAPTAQKKIASHMWNDFTRGLALEGGGALYCDSCHGGQKEFLDRSDKHKLAEWMQTHYTAKMKRVDGKEHGCETCHGDPFEADIFGKLWK